MTKAARMHGISLHDAKLMVGKGWHNLLRRCYAALPATGYVADVKEKFGALRFYCSGVSFDTLDAIDAICDESAHVCEFCGAVGRIMDINGWYKCVCQNCAEDRFHWRERQ